MYYIDVILPIPLQKLFTYKVTEEEAAFLSQGVRVAVPFGKRKVYTGIVYSLHTQQPAAYEAKNIHSILDEHALVTAAQLKLWEWMAQYYMCTLGEVVRAALPSAFLLQSETQILPDNSFEAIDSLTDREYLVYEGLQHNKMLDLSQVSAILAQKNSLPVVKSLLEKKAIRIHEVLYEKYTPKLVKYLRLHPLWQDENRWHDLLDGLNRAPKQKQAVMAYFKIKAETGKPIAFTKFLKEHALSHAILRALVEKEVFELYTLQEDRVKIDKSSKGLPVLNPGQTSVFEQIQDRFKTRDVVLFHGVTGSGKTEVYIRLIADVLAKGQQVLYLVPEIALTTQLLERLKLFFGEKISVFHSRYSLNERVEVWYHMLNKNAKAQLIVGARSAVLLPFHNLGLIVVDEEHEVSYKQFDPAPRYHARDTAVFLAHQFKAKIVLGTATPSIESQYNVDRGKYALVELKERFGDVALPDIQLVNLSEAHKKKRVQGHFSLELIEAMEAALDRREQVILFQNRRGFAPVVQCTSCGTSPHCPNCDVSLTYHKANNELRCHYCGFGTTLMQDCEACGNPTLINLGFGTEQLEEELKDLFPNHKTMRMDYDTTRGKRSYQEIISKFQAHTVDILVGTQMLSKGLDFSNVSLVGVINADGLLNFPDFRAHERSFQMLVQVSGRSGRSGTKGKVIIQTYNPNHPILQWVKDNAYNLLYDNQLKERSLCHYPPYHKLIKITLKHKNQVILTEAAEWLGVSLKNYFAQGVLGPSVPGIARIRGLYLYDLLLKIPPEQSVFQTKQQLLKIKNHFQSIGQYRSIRFVLDVDPF